MAAPRFDPSTLTNAANESFAVRRVFGDAYERAGALVIPVARVWGATGSGSGGGEMGLPHHGEEGAAEKSASEGHGGGGGYATHVKAVGVFVVDDSGTHWQPTLDVNRVILGGQLVAAAVLTVFALAWAVKRR
ncbi:hypothetical protein [Cellulomonas sp. URHD0024]|uniref:hypothetical protein n=1 Tax=Cellulomonas sp. URHD0024 TaxID=1302620 RepID=UPI0004031632|nr:hypothetical protein [Cellulomonas sp. URHD0024]